MGRWSKLCDQKNDKQWRRRTSIGHTSVASDVATTRSPALQTRRARYSPRSADLALTSIQARQLRSRVANREGNRRDSPYTNDLANEHARRIRLPPRSVAKPRLPRCIAPAGGVSLLAVGHGRDQNDLGKALVVCAPGELQTDGKTTYLDKVIPDVRPRFCNRLSDLLDLQTGTPLADRVYLEIGRDWPAARKRLRELEPASQH